MHFLASEMKEGTMLVHLLSSQGFPPSQRFFSSIYLETTLPRPLHSIEVFVIALSKIISVVFWHLY